MYKSAARFSQHTFHAYKDAVSSPSGPAGKNWTSQKSLEKQRRKRSEEEAARLENQRKPRVPSKTKRVAVVRIGEGRKKPAAK